MKAILICIVVFGFVFGAHAQTPTVTFTATPSVICPGDGVNFTDSATNFPVSWTWYMPGSSISAYTTIIIPGNPPPVTYNTPGTYYVTCVVRNHAGMDSVTIQNCVTVNVCSSGISELSENGTIKIYPNPSNGVFTLQANSYQPIAIANSHVEIYNILGEKVLTETLRSTQGNNVINLSDQPNGVYLYRAVAENGSLLGQGKLVVQK
jgi:PKD repeat protein